MSTPQVQEEQKEPYWKLSPWFVGPAFAVFRQGRFIVVELDASHRVMTTSAYIGGLSVMVRRLVNHQSCEAKDHADRYSKIRALGAEGYHRQVCSELALDPEHTAVMGTAANMIYAAHESASHNGIRVDAIVTAGVEGNACCAGDPAQWEETPSGWNKLPQVSGTINTMVMLNQPLRAEAQVRALLTITEAKSAALMELGVSSRYSQDLATGTGTDQICFASVIDEAKYAYTSTSPHVKLGELLGRVVRDATRNALRWQNGLEPSITRSLFHALRRFGFTEAGFIEAMRSRITEASHLLLEKNRNAVLYEPQVAAAAYAFASVWDRIRYGVLPRTSAGEVFRQHAATLAASLAAQPENWHTFWQRLEVNVERPIDSIYDAVALGWMSKWAQRD
jgi:adenosylcobinamide amidohydrolase